jgi:hypothetical protein
MKYFELTISWNVENGTQLAYAYVFASCKAEAQRIVLSKTPYDANVSDFAEHPASAYKFTDKVKLWYFDKDKTEHREEYA